MTTATASNAPLQSKIALLVLADDEFNDLTSKSFCSQTPEGNST